MSTDSVFMRESLLQEPVGDRVRCNVCERRCVLGNGATGWCRTREVRDGRLFTRIYGALSAVERNPIEKKPFYHFYPGTAALTAGSWSCNLGCPWCQNWEISHVAPPRNGEYISPERFVRWTEGGGCQGTSISFNEPTLSLEWSLEVFQFARRRGLYNTFVSNGYMTPEGFELLADAGLDAVNVDVKGDTEAVRQFCQGDVEKVWQICARAKARGIHLEVTTLIIPNINDSDETLTAIAERIVRELGSKVPWHVTGYAPAYIFTEPATSRAALERGWWIGKQAGLEFVYVGNLPGHRYENTHCPVCDALLIRRLGYEVLSNVLRDSACPECGHPIAGVWSR